MGLKKGSPDAFLASEFDDWAETYDGSVSVDQFPFYGYKEVLGKTVELAKACPGISVLDLGTGTGNLALLFARLGCSLWCTDFSEPMLAKALQKLPQAHFCLHNLHDEWPAGFPDRFDRIVSAYVFHHFELDEKIRLVNNLIKDHLTPGGRLVIADIAFPDRPAQTALKEAVGSEWEEEYYWIADEAVPAFEVAGTKLKYVQVSACAGIFAFRESLE